MGFYEYDVTSIRRAFRYKAARSVVLNPLFGRWWLKQDIPEVLSKLRRLWHKRLLVLQKAGWTRLAVGNGKFPYAANCPPFGVTTDQQGRVCKLLACPFCHARKALDAFMQLEWVLYGSFEPEATPRRSDVVLVDFRTRRTLQADAFDTTSDPLLEQAARDEAELASRIDYGQPSVVVGNVSDLQLLEELLSLTEEHLSGMSSDELVIWKRISAVVADRCELGL